MPPTITFLLSFLALTRAPNRYLCYATNTVQFIPISDVKARYTYATTHGITSKDAINRDLSKNFLDAGEAQYNIQNILTYGSA